MENPEKYWNRTSLKNKKTVHMQKYFSHNIKIVVHVYKYSHKKQLPSGKDTCIYRSQDGRAEKQEAIIHWKIGRKNKEE